MISTIEKALGEKTGYYLSFSNPKISKDRLHLPGPDFVDRSFAASRSQQPRAGEPATDGRPRPPGDTGYLRSCRWTRASSIRPAPASPRIPNTSIPKTSSSWPSKADATPWLRPSASWAWSPRKYAHKIPFLVKINHNELLTYPNKSDQIMFGTVEAGLRHGRGRGRRNDLFRLGRIAAADRRGQPGLRRGPRNGHGDGAVVLPAQPRVQEQGQGLSRLGRSDRPGQSPGRARSRPTSSSRSCPRTTAASKR